MSRNFLLIDPEERADVLHGLASPVRVKILRELHVSGGLNVNDIASKLELPQSTISSNLSVLEDAGLVDFVDVSMGGYHALGKLIGAMHEPSGYELATSEPVTRDARVPTIVAITFDRPAVIPEIAARSAALLADFGAADDAILDVVFGRFPPSGKLPFELPASMEAVRRQKSDVPYDSDEPLFAFGHGLSY